MRLFALASFVRETVMPAQKKCAARFRSGLLPIVLTAWLMTIGTAHASDVDSEHLFGFTEGADIGKKGEREAETDNRPLRQIGRLLYGAHAE